MKLFSNIFNKIFRRNYVSDLWIARKTIDTFNIMISMYSGVNDVEFIEFNARRKFIMNLSSIKKTGTLTPTSFAKITSKDACRILNLISESFPHYSDIVNPAVIYQSEELNVTMNETCITFERIDIENRETHELALYNTNIAELLQTFADCINFVYSPSTEKTLNLETDPTENEFSEDGEICDYKESIVRIVVDKDDKKFNLFEITDNETEKICTLSIVELSKILQKMREYKDSIIQEIDKGFVYWY